jgi:8-oxo-dGTP diphosphatase
MIKPNQLSLWKSMFLLFIAFVLLVTTAPFGFLYALIRQTSLKKVDALSVYFLELALSIDNAGNVLMQHVLNDLLLIQNKKTYNFGNKLETISSVIGKNDLTNTLSKMGITLNAFLHWVDKDHAFNSINYNVRFWKQNNRTKLI